MKIETIKAHFAGHYNAFYGKYLPSIKKIGGQEFSALCPFHDDTNPSFNFNNDNGQFFCHGCGKKGNIIHFFAKLHNLNEKHDFPKILKQIAADFGIPDDEVQPKLVKTYDYLDEEGKLLFQVCRYEPKTFKQRHGNGTGKWIYNLEGIRRVLYRLPDVLKASEVVIVEGEKDSDNVSELGFCGTTCPMGAKKWRPEYSESLKDKDVILVPDNDDEGRTHMLRVAQSLQGIAKSIKWIQLEGLPSKGDISDWIDKFSDKTEAAERLSVLIEAAPIYKPPKKHTIDDIIFPSQDFINIELPERKSYMYPIIGEQQIILLPGFRGVGKTFLALSMADAITAGKDLGPWQARESVPTLYLDGEMAVQDIRSRLRLLNPSDERKSPLYLYSDAYANLLGIPRASLLSESWRSTIKRIISARHIKFFIIDNIASLAAGIDENKKSEWDVVNQWLIELRFTGVTTLLLHHTGKDGNDQRGTSAREDNVDLSILLKRPPNYSPENGADFIVSFSKARVPFEVLKLMQDYRFTLTQDDAGNTVWKYGTAKAEVRKEVQRMLSEGHQYDEIAATLGITKGYISRIKKESAK